MSGSIQKRLRISYSFTRGNNAVVLGCGQSVANALDGNTLFTKTPVELPLLKTTLNTYSIAIGDAVDGGTRAIVERDRLRAEVIKMLRSLAHYVETTCHDDLTGLLSSGFEQLIVTRSAPQPLEPTSIRRIDQGNTGQLLLKVANSPKAWSYELRYAPLEPSGAPGTWESQAVTSVHSLIPCNGLKPGTTYAFQVRALGRLGFSDWSDTVTRMCT